MAHEAFGMTKVIPAAVDECRKAFGVPEYRQHVFVQAVNNPPCSLQVASANPISVPTTHQKQRPKVL